MYPHQIETPGTPSKLNRRQLLRAMGIGAAGMALVACAPAGPAASSAENGNSPAGETVTLIHQCRTGVEQEHYSAELELFQESHEGILVELQATPDADFQQKLATLVAGGELGDAYWGNVFGQLYPFASAGVATDISSLAEAAGWRTEDYFDFGIQQLTWEGKLIGIPLAGHAGWSCMWTNVTAFNEAGAPLPEWEWNYQDQWLDAVKAATFESGGEIQKFGYQFDYTAQNAYTFIRSWGSDWIDPEERRTSWVNKPETVEALAFMRDLVYTHRVSPRQDQIVEDMFINNLVSSWSHGIWFYGRGQAAIADAFEWRNFPMPAGPGGRGSFTGCDTFCINSGSEHPTETFAWGQWLASLEPGLRQLERGISPPFLIEAWDSPQLAEDPSYEATVQWLEIATPWSVPANARSVEFRNTFNQGIQSVLNDQNDFMTEIENLHLAIQGVLDKPAV